MKKRRKSIGLKMLQKNQNMPSGNPRREGQSNREAMMGKNFCNLGKKMDIHIREAQRPSIKLNPKSLH